MKIYKQDKYGYYRVGDKKYYSNYEAYSVATKVNLPVRFIYNDMVWHNFDRKLVGKKSLDEVYKERAQQIRDKYDYLILYYSGGADSHNILKVFIDNNIKLDEVCVKWPKALIENRGIYTSNNIDTSARNYWSEWDYCIKPCLDWLAINKPEIKITIKDFIGNPDTFNADKIFDETMHHAFQAGILINSQVSDSELPLIESGKTVGNIYGVNKPLLSKYNNMLFTFFTDVPLRDAVRSLCNPYGAECFYWDPEFPLVLFEQINQCLTHYKLFPDDLKYMVLPKEEQKPDDLPSSIKTEIQGEIHKQYIYKNTWDYRFQTKKPNTAARIDKFSWFFENNELKRPKEMFIDNINQRLNSISDNFLTIEKTNHGVLKSLNPCGTRWFYVCDLN